jgi:hypothetical protein
MNYSSNKNSRNIETKICIVCQRLFMNRKKWSSRGIWDKVIYCSTACSRMKNNEIYKKKFLKKDL